MTSLKVQEIAILSVATILSAALSAPAAIVNVGRQGFASQSSTRTGAPQGNKAMLALDGNTNGNYGGLSVTHTNNVANSFWETSLGADFDVSDITLFNRTDCCVNRLGNFRLSVFDGATEVFGQNVGPTVVGSQNFALPGGTVGDRVRVQLNGLNNEGTGTLSLAEVQIFSDLAASHPLLSNNANIARFGSASQSSTRIGSSFQGDVAQSAIDGSTDGIFNNGSVTHTTNVPNSSWEVDLGSEQAIQSVKLFNRADCCGNRLGNFRLSVLDSGASEVFGQDFPGSVAQGGNIEIPVPFGVEGQTVRVQLNGNNNEGNGVLSLAEVQVHGGVLDNLARNPQAVASQSSTRIGGGGNLALFAIDGITDGVFNNGSVTHTLTENDPWWEVDLGFLGVVHEVILHNRTDCCTDRLSNADVEFYNEGNLIATLTGGVSTNQQQIRFFLGEANALRADRIRVQLNGVDRVLSLAEFQAFGVAHTPEPTTAVLGLGGGAALLLRRRRTA